MHGAAHPVQLYRVDIDPSHVVAAALDGAVVCECSSPSDLLAESGLENDHYFSILKFFALVQDIKRTQKLPSPSSCEDTLSQWLAEQISANPRLASMPESLSRFGVSAAMMRMLEATVAAPMLGVTSKDLRSLQRSFTEAHPGKCVFCVERSSPVHSRVSRLFLTPLRVKLRPRYSSLCESASSWRASRFVLVLRVGHCMDH